MASAAPAALLPLLCILAVEVGRSLLEAPGLPVWAGVWVLLPAPWPPGVSPPRAPGEACSWHAPAPEAPAWQPSDFPWALPSYSEVAPRCKARPISFSERRLS